jgi:hypothetical protein
MFLMALWQVAENHGEAKYAQIIKNLTVPSLG